jgi:ectoine hydroxylase-related dioxygenase (phytanoyl-CoA dioxygenase family)
MILRTTFRDDVLQREFAENGYIIVEGLSKEEIEIIKTGYDSLVDPEPRAFEATIYNKSNDHKRQVNELISPFSTKLIQKYLSDYKPVTSSILRKLPSQDSVISPHQDWTICDESQYTAVSIWIPMIDLNEENGQLYILKYGQRLPVAIRGNGTPLAFDFELFKDYKLLTPLEMKAGQAAIYDIRCIHSSPPNLSNYPRLVVATTAIPSEAVPMHYFYDNKAKVLNCYEAGTEFHENYTFNMNQIFEKTKLLESIPNYVPTTFSTSEQKKILRLQHPTTKIFKQEQHQEQYERDGYILIDFLDIEETRHLLAQLESKINGWFKDGWFDTKCNPIEGIEEWADKLLKPFGDRLSEQIMVDYEVIESAIRVKGSGGDSAMGPHQDCNIVDETKYASFIVWIPLIDVDYKNGALSVMRGGHKLPFTIRGLFDNIPPAWESTIPFKADKLTYIPMKAGQALIMNHRCIHVSPPNQTTKVRPACLINMAPKGVQTFYYFYDKRRDVLQRYKHEKDFHIKKVDNNYITNPNSVLLDEVEAPIFPKFTDELLKPLLAQQIPRKKGFFEKWFGSKL